MRTLKRRIALWLAHRVAKLRFGLPSALPALGDIRRITVLKLDRIGDFVLSTAFLRPLSEQLRAEVTLIVRKPIGSIARQQFPDWKIIELPPRENAFRNVFRQGVRNRLTQLKKADLLVDLRSFRDYSDAVIASWISASCKIALTNSYSFCLQSVVHTDEARIYDRLIPHFSIAPGEVHDLANSRALATALGIFLTAPARPRFIAPAVDYTDTAQIVEQVTGGKPYVLICPGTSSPIREYPPEQLALAIRAVAKKHTALKWLIAGSEHDAVVCKRLADELRHDIKVHNFCGQFTLPKHVALLSGAKAVLCMETSHAHLAGALKKPCVIILGGGHYGEFAPWGEGIRMRWIVEKMACFGCNWQCIYERPICIHNIPAVRIASALNEVLDN